MRFRGITDFPTVEPGLSTEYEFDYALGSETAPFDPISAMRFGAELNSPLEARYVPFAHAASRSYFSVDRANVRIGDVKQAASGQSEAITPTSLSDVKSTRQLVIRLQEIAGRDTPHAFLALPRQALKAEIVDLTETHVIAPLTVQSPLDVPMAPYQTVTVRVEMKDE